MHTVIMAHAPGVLVVTISTMGVLVVTRVRRVIIRTWRVLFSVVEHHRGLYFPLVKAVFTVTIYRGTFITDTATPLITITPITVGQISVQFVLILRRCIPEISGPCECARLKDLGPCGCRIRMVSRLEDLGPCGCRIRMVSRLEDLGPCGCRVRMVSRLGECAI
jgi:hypothetical protein